MEEHKRKAWFMQEAYKQAQQAFAADEVPVGAVIVKGMDIIAKAHNQVETLKDPSAHAEMIAITQAANALGQKWLHECEIYVTIEPCAMCAGALILARIDSCVYAARDPKAGACQSVMNVMNHPKLNHRIEVEEGLMEAECSALIKEFFQAKRAKEKG